MKTPVYLRDLNSNLRAITEESIRENRPDLVKHLDENEDITIGYYIVEGEYYHD